MNKKLNAIMLIDDDSNINLYHRIIIQKIDIADNIKVFQNGKLALDYLIKKNEEGQFPTPDLILLDINMPVMNGWEFLDHYKKLKKEQQNEITIFILTSSMNYDDKEKASKNETVKEYLNKPLKTEVLKQLVEKYF